MAATTVLVTAAVTQQTAVLVCLGIVLVMVFALAWRSLSLDERHQRFALAVIGLLLGLFGGGGIGALVGGQSADKAANSVKSQASTIATQAANQAVGTVTRAVTNAVKSTRSGR